MEAVVDCVTGGSTYGSLIGTLRGFSASPIA
jgi:hypothetical protein